MNCCDYQCDQGRNCPARVAKVACVGQRMLGPEPLPASTWRQVLRSVVLWMLVAMLAANMAVLVMVVLA